MRKYIKMICNILMYGGIYIGFQAFIFFIFTFVFTMIQEMIGEGSSNIENLLQDFLMKNSNVVLILSAVFSMFIYVSLLRYRSEGFIKYCNFFKISAKNVVLILIMGLGLNLLLQSILMYLPIETMFPEYIETMEMIAGGGQNEILVLVGVGILIPIFEEVLFRGLILNELKKYLNIKTAIIIQALLFGIFHWNLLQGSYAAILGLVLGMVYMWTGTIWAPIITHIIFNSASLFYEYVSTSDSVWGMTAFGLIISSVLIIVIYRINVKNS